MEKRVSLDKVRVTNKEVSRKKLMWERHYSDMVGWVVACIFAAVLVGVPVYLANTGDYTKEDKATLIIGLLVFAVFFSAVKLFIGLGGAKADPCNERIANSEKASEVITNNEGGLTGLFLNQEADNGDYFVEDAVGTVLFYVEIDEYFKPESIDFLKVGDYEVTMGCEEEKVENYAVENGITYDDVNFVVDGAELVEFEEIYCGDEYKGKEVDRRTVVLRVKPIKEEHENE